MGRFPWKQIENPFFSFHDLTDSGSSNTATTVSYYACLLYMDVQEDEMSALILWHVADNKTY